MATFSFKLNIGDRVLVLHDPTKTPKKIKGIFIDQRNYQYYVSDGKDSNYEYEEDLELITAE